TGATRRNPGNPRGCEREERGRGPGVEYRIDGMSIHQDRAEQVRIRALSLLELENRYGLCRGVGPVGHGPSGAIGRMIEPHYTVCEIKLDIQHSIEVLAEHSRNAVPQVVGSDEECGVAEGERTDLEAFYSGDLRDQVAEAPRDVEAVRRRAERQMEFGRLGGRQRIEESAGIHEQAGFVTVELGGDGGAPAHHGDGNRGGLHQSALRRYPGYGCAERQREKDPTASLATLDEHCRPPSSLPPFVFTSCVRVRGPCSQSAWRCRRRVSRPRRYQSVRAPCRPGAAPPGRGRRVRWACSN